MSDSVSVRGYVNPEMADFTQAVIDEFFDEEYFENEYSGRVTDYERLKEIEKNFYDNLEAVLEGLDLNFSDVESLEDFHEASVLDSVHPEASPLNDVPEALEDKYLVEFQDGEVFYGPLAFPYLKLRSELEEAIRDEEWYPEEENVEEGQSEGLEEEEDEEKDLHDIFEEVSGGEHVETLEQKDDGGLETRDHTKGEDEAEDVDMDDDAGYEGIF
ncbi:MAG: hypothetical protein ABEK04_03025 [Candidatus Nanohalobium sp.]